MSAGGQGASEQGPTWSTPSTPSTPSRTHLLGPLTTTFTPPPGCTIAVMPCSTCSDSALLAQTCAPRGATDDTSCWPPVTAGAAAPDLSPGTGGFYSPGRICPLGYATACSASTTSVAGTWTVQFGLESGETVVGCCPTGYSCTNKGGQSCVLRATSTVLPTVTCQGVTSDGFGFMTLPRVSTLSVGTSSLLTTASISTFTVFAPLIQLNYRATEPGGGPTPASSGGSGTRLSTGARTGIGVGVGVVGILLIFVVLLAYVYFCNPFHRRRQTSCCIGEGVAMPNPPQGKYELRGDSASEQHAESSYNPASGNPEFGAPDGSGTEAAQLPDRHHERTLDG